MIRGNSTLTTAAQAAYVVDFALGGIAFDLQETPCAWLEADRAAQQVKVPPLAEVLPETLPTMRAGATLLRPSSGEPMAASVALSAAPVWRVTHGGSPEGVMVILAGEGAPEGDDAVLLRAMLRAVGLAELPLAWVALAGAVARNESDAAATALRAAAGPYQPQHTLVLGQGPVGALCGKPLGVEGWHAAPQDLALPGRCGVTYAFALLRSKPLFKSLAWQHLQAWQE